MVERASLKDITEFTANSEGWILDAEKIIKIFLMENFEKAIEFANKIAEISKQIQHFPEISIQANQVKISLFTDMISGISKEDILLATEIDKLQNQE